MTTVLIALAIFIALVMVVLLILLLIILSERLRRVKHMDQDGAGPVFDGLSSFFTTPERELVHALGDCLGKGYRIFGKVRLADMIVPSESMNPAISRRVRGRAERRRVDVVVCRADDFSVLGAIEVLDSAAFRPENHIRSGFMEDALASAGIPFLRLAAQEEYDLVELLNQINGAFGLGEAPPPERKPKPTAVQPPNPQPIPAPAVPAKTTTVAPIPLVTPEAPSCSDCGADLVRRVARAPDGNAHTFWGCCRYPECSFVQPMSE